MELDTWGLHNHLIEFRLKVRMTEDLIDCAQRLQVKPDKRTEAELKILSLLRDRTYDDLRFFVKEREKKLWRNWEIFGQVEKPALDNRGLTLQEVTERIELQQKMIAFIEPRLERLVKDIPPYNCINSEMIEFYTKVFGNEAWL